MPFEIQFAQPILPPYENGLAIEIEVSYDYTDEDVRKKFVMDGLEDETLEEIVNFLDNHGRLDPTKLEKHPDFRRLFGWQDFINNGVWPFDRFNPDNEPTAFCSYQLFYYKNGVAYPVIKVEKEKNFVELYLEGRKTLEDIHDHIDDWHEGESKASLPEYLGLTEEEYAAWVQKDSALKDILNKKKVALEVEKEPDGIYIMVWIEEESKWYYFRRDFGTCRFPNGYVDYHIEVKNGIIKSDSWSASHIGKKFEDCYDKSLWYK